MCTKYEEGRSEQYIKQDNKEQATVEEDEE